MSSPERFEVVVIGAGIVGLATARALLALRPSDLLVLEAENRTAAHQTGNNSGVLHSGLYYRPGSLKATLCSEGRRAMERYCIENDIPFERCGKVVVATNESQLPALEELELRGQANGLEDVRRLDAAGLREHEPHLVGVAGLFVGDTGIVDYKQVASSFARDVQASSGEVHLSRAAGAIRRENGRYIIETPTGEVSARCLINCGGVQADRIARRAGLRPKSRIVPFRGEYKLLRPASRQLVKNLIYPVPDPRFPFLGVHFTRGTSGEIEAGPNAVLALSRNGYRWSDVSARDLIDMASFPGFWRMAARYWKTGFGELHRSLSHGAFTHALQQLIPELRPEDLSYGGAGVRAQALDPDGTLADDFRFTEGENALHVLCAPSPAATASIAIGEQIAQRAARLFGW
ncbi:MAG: L-2-hydroxyglutarate oxidase [Chlamydiales bacterium]|jgi:L-2-hydroxyglutarate oxidase